ncbi:MAG: D-alanyl-D-alanine carboxypeptidase [Clostridia bacterium]|nr:D-alanyl-D-alanine carboxypeptidase [Clostridia bacterium]
MSKFLSLILSFIFTFFSFVSVLYAQDISARHAVLIEADSGDIVYKKDAYAIAPMASTTKIMTALLAIESGKLNNTVTVPYEATGIEGSSIYLKEGEKLTLSQLVYALMLESANDAATAIAIYVGGTYENFIEMMNTKAHQLGLDSTHFTNPHGLDDPEHYTTAYDLAHLALYAMKNPKFEEIVATKKLVIPLYDDGSRVLVNHNKLLRMYDGAIGVKTGFTKKCGRCLVSCAERDGVKLICTTLNAPNDWNDHKNLLDFGFSQYECITLAEAGDYTLSLDLVGGEKSNILCSNYDSLSVTLKKGNRDNIRAVTEYDRLLCAPIKQGDKVGRILFYCGDRIIGECKLYALENIKAIKYKKSFLERIFG